MPVALFSLADGCPVSAKPKAKPKPKEAGGKQATLFGMKNGMPPPPAFTRESFESTETEEDCEETMRDDVPRRILEESQVCSSLVPFRSG